MPGLWGFFLFSLGQQRSISPPPSSPPATGFLFLAESVVCGIGKVEILQYSLMSTGPFIARLWTEKSKYHNTISRHAGPPFARLRTEKSKYYTYNSRHAAPLVAISTACRALVARSWTEKSKYHTCNSRHAAPLVAIRKSKSRNLPLTKYFITTLLVICQKSQYFVAPLALIHCNLGSISLTFYVQLLDAKISKVQKRLTAWLYFLRFWDLFA